jgi:glycosyltransferase involved in cell wall biosynthesis
MMLEPLVSIVTVSFNQARFLAECLDSILGQGYPRIEYIVMDGGSTDGSVELIRVRESRLAHWQSGADGGAASALNEGFALATGEIFAYLNSDDVLCDGAVRRWVEEFHSTSADIVYGDVAIVDGDGEPSRLPGRKVSTFRAGTWSLRSHAAGAIAIPQQASAWKRSVHEKVGGFNIANRTCWDGEFFVQAAILGSRFRRVPRILAQFRVHEESISGSGRTEDLYRADQARIDAMWRQAGLSIPRSERALRRLAVKGERFLRGGLRG